MGKRRQPKAGNPKKPPLNARQAAFVREYLKDQNGTRAARAAGYSAKTAHAQATRLLKHAEVKKQIDAVLGRAIETLSMEAQITAERTLREIARIAYADPRKMFDATGRLLTVPEMDDDAIGALQAYDVARLVGDSVGETVKIRMHPKLPALERLMDYLRLTPPKRHEVTGADGGPVKTEHDLSDEDLLAIIYAARAASRE